MDAAVPVDAKNAPTRDLENRRERGFPQRPHASSSSWKKIGKRLTHRNPDTPEQFDVVTRAVIMAASSPFYDGNDVHVFDGASFHDSLNDIKPLLSAKRNNDPDFAGALDGEIYGVAERLRLAGDRLLPDGTPRRTDISELYEAVNRFYFDGNPFSYADKNERTHDVDFGSASHSDFGHFATSRSMQCSGRITAIRDSGSAIDVEFEGLRLRGDQDKLLARVEYRARYEPKEMLPKCEIGKSFSFDGFIGSESRYWDGDILELEIRLENPKCISAGASTDKAKTGCFIATAAYGADAAEQLDVLRYFRDNVLMLSWLGRHFVSLYYLLSPKAAAKLAKSDRARAFVRWLLDPAVGLIRRYRRPDV